ncbi:MAG: magnesium protoporphyrin IX methyltransferase [Pseudomonadota bacterium]
MSYARTLAQVETYFDKTATRTWERLTSDAPVSRIRQTVRAGRDEMRALLLSRLPRSLEGKRVLDAGCGAGQMSAALVERGAEVVAVDISPALIDIARDRLGTRADSRVQFVVGDMLDASLGAFDHVVAMDSLIYYNREDLATALQAFAARTRGSMVFTVAPRTPLLLAMWQAGRLFPRSDRSPQMVPHSVDRLSALLSARGSSIRLTEMPRVTSGFYISQPIEMRP